MAKFDSDDDSVVVIIGSGAGGGTLANELCQKGIKVVVLEAGAMQSPRQLHQRRMEVVRPARLAGHAHHLGHLARGEGLRRPAGVDLQDRRRHHHALGRRLAAPAGARVQGAHDVYGDIKGANLMDWPLTLKELEPYYAKAEDKMGVTRTNGIPGLPGNNNFKVMYAGAKKLGYKEVHTGNMAINSQPRDGRGRCMQLGFCFQGCKSGAKWSHAVHRDAQGRGDRQPRPAPASRTSRSIEHDDSRQGHRRRLLRQGRQGAAPEGAHRLRRRQLDRDAAPAAAVGLDQVQGRPGQLVRPGRAQLHAPHDRLGLRRVQEAGAHVPRHDHGRHHPRRGRRTTPKRGFAGGYEMETLSLGVPVHGRLPRPGRLGRGLRLVDGQLHATWPACGSSARTCRARPTASR